MSSKIMCPTQGRTLVECRSVSQASGISYGSHMHLGIKVGPDNWRQKLCLSRLDIPRIEIYYNFTYKDDYPALFSWMQERGIKGRLHASTPLQGGVFPTLATADHDIRRTSAEVIRRTVDVAAGNGIGAVIVHPGSYRIPRLRNGRVDIVGRETPTDEGTRWLIQEALALVSYARERGVEPLFENMPGREFAGYGPIGRQGSVDVRFVPHTVLLALGQAGVGLCVDLAHFYSELMVKPGLGPWDVLGSGNNGLHARIMDATRELVPYAQHLHLSTITPPLNGTDSHTGFLEADYAQGAIPDQEHLLSWLRLFAGRDVWIIPEPNGGADVHLANYHRLSEWLKEFI